MIETVFTGLISSAALKQAVADIINAIAAEETALSNILSLENDLIQKAGSISTNLEEFVAINESVNSVIRTITKVQTLTQIKLQHLKELIQAIEDLPENDGLEE